MSCNNTYGYINSTIFSVEVNQSVEFPIVNIIYPINTAYTESKSILNYTVSCSDTCDKCWYTTDGGATNSSPVDAGENFTEVSSSEGSNEWTVYCNCTEELTGEDTVYFSVDTIGPIVNIVLPSGTYETMGSIPLNYTVSDTGTGIDTDTCKYSLNDDLNVSVLDCLNTTMSNSTQEGINTVRLCVEDLVGNEGCDVQTFAINTQPNTLLITPYEEDYEWNQSISITSLCKYTNSSVCAPIVHCRLTSYYPNMSVVISEGLMNYSAGTYTYDVGFTGVGQNILGNYSSIVSCYNGGVLSEAPFTYFVVNSSTTIGGGTANICRYRKFGYYDIKLPFMKEPDCI
jgi:hypothetical protein